MDSNVSGSGGTLTASAARFHGIYAAARSWGTGATSDPTPMSNSGTIKNMYVSYPTAPGVGITRTFTLYKNGVATGLTATTADNGTTAEDLDAGHAVSYVAGDTLSIATTASATTASTGGIGWSFLLTAAANVSQVGSISGVNLANGTAAYMGLMGTNAYDLTAANVEQIIPTGGTLKNMYIVLNGAPTAGKNYAFTLYVNGSPTTLTATVADTNTTANDTTHSVAVSAGDLVYIETVPTGTPTARQAAIGMEFDPTINGESLQMHGGEDALSNASPRYISVNGDSAPNSSENTVNSASQACVVMKCYAKLSAAPGAGKSRQFQFVINSSAGNPSFTISDAATTANDTTNTRTVTAGQSISYLSTPSGTPSTTFAEVSCVTYIEPPSTFTPKVIFM